MKSDFDLDQQELVLIGVKQKLVKDIPELKSKQLDIQSLRVMHSPELTSMLGMENFRNLIHLNLSQNNIEKVEGLENAFYLQTLNLSGNRIRMLQNLQAQKNLLVLNISYNKIALLQYLQIFKGDDYCLKTIDFRCNQISDLKELTFIQGIITLTEAHFDSPKKANPICTNKQTYYRAILSLQNCPNLQIIDKININDIERQVFNNKQHVIDDNIPKKKPKNIMSPQKPLPDWVEREAQYRVDVLQLQSKIEDLMEAQQQLLYKFECNEKYWSGKSHNLETEILDYQKEQQDAKREIIQLKKEFQIVQTQLIEEKNQKQILVAKREKKDEMIESLQNRVNDLIQENGRLQKETQIRNEDLQVLKGELSDKQKTMTDLKNSLRQSENQLQTFHQKAVEQAQQSLFKQEATLNKYEVLTQENKNHYLENTKLKQRIQELLDICREWENKYDISFNEHTQSLEASIAKVQQESHKLIQQKDLEHQKEKIEIEKESKRLQDLLESEVRKVLLENIEKYRQLKQAFEEKSKTEIEIKQALKITLIRNQENEVVIQELQSALLKIRKEVADYVVEKNELVIDYNNKIQQYKIEINQQHQINEKLQVQVKTLDQDNKQLKDQNDSFMTENDKFKQRSKHLMQIEAELDELQTLLTIKNKMLDDKNETIDDLKSQFENIKSSEQTATEDYNRLLRRYERQNQIIEELEGQLNNLQEEHDIKIQELKDRKNIIHVFEKELEEIKEKQENEMQQLKAENQDKDQNLLNLIKLLDDARDNLKRRDEKIKERNLVANQLEKKLQNIDKQYEKHLAEKDKEVNFMRIRLEQAQDELRTLIQEMDKQKKAAKENLDKLQKVFNL